MKQITVQQIPQDQESYIQFGLTLNGANCTVYANTTKEREGMMELVKALLVKVDSGGFTFGCVGLKLFHRQSRWGILPYRK